MTLWDSGSYTLQWGVVLLTSLVAAVTDLHARRVPNLLTFPVLLGGLLWATYEHGAAGLADAAVACVLLALPFVVLFVLANGGAGDAKLMGALGAWLGVLNGLVVLFCVVVSGMVLAIGLSLARRQLTSVFANLRRMVTMVATLALVGRSLDDATGLLAGTAEMKTMPYAVAIFCGVCLAAGGILVWRVA